MPAEEIFVHILIDTLFLLVILKSVNKLSLYDLEPKQVLKLNIKVFDFSIILITLIISSIMRAEGGVFSCSTVEWWGLFYRLSLGTAVGLQQLDTLIHRRPKPFRQARPLLRNWVLSSPAPRRPSWR